MMLNLITPNTPSVAASQTPTKPLPSGMKSTTEVANAALTSTTGSAGMGQKDFLTLFTTQLKNQDPLDPVKNEAFVAQLAQFSQLEATTGMAQTLTNFVDSQSGQQIMSSSSLIGKRVDVPGGPATWMGNQPVNATVNLASGADGVKFDVLDSKGITVRSQILGAQTAGNATWSWDGKDDAGNAVANGAYQFQATAVSKGVFTNPSVSSMATVTSVSQASDKTMLLQIEGGMTVKLADVKSISY